MNHAQRCNKAKKHFGKGMRNSPNSFVMPQKDFGQKTNPPQPPHHNRCQNRSTSMKSFLNGQKFFDFGFIERKMFTAVSYLCATDLSSLSSRGGVNYFR